MSKSIERRCKKMPRNNTAFNFSTHARTSMPMEEEHVSLALAWVSFTAWCKHQAKLEPLLGWEKINLRTGKCN